MYPIHPLILLLDTSGDVIKVEVDEYIEGIARESYEKEDNSLW